MIADFPGQLAQEAEGLDDAQPRGVLGQVSGGLQEQADVEDALYHAAPQFPGGAAGQLGPPVRWVIPPGRGAAERDGPDVADHAVNFPGRGRYPVTGGASPDDTPRALQAQPHGKQPGHDVLREL